MLIHRDGAPHQKTLIPCKIYSSVGLINLRGWLICADRLMGSKDLKIVLNKNSGGEELEKVFNGRNFTYGIIGDNFTGNYLGSVGLYN